MLDNEMKKSMLEYPWKLLERGGAVEGQRIRTALYYITEVKNAPHGEYYKGYPFAQDGRRLSKHGRQIIYSEPFAEWKERPSKTEIARAKKAVPVFMFESKYTWE